MNPSLSHTEGRIVVTVDMQYKNTHQFEDGTKIKLIRQVDNFDRTYTEPVNGIVVSANGIPSGAEILISHNGTHDTYRIFNYKKTSGTDIANDIKYYSIPEDQCYLWRSDSEDWHPLPGFATALRVYEPYNGPLAGIEPKQLKDTLFITSGEYKGLVVKTVRAADYMIIFQEKNGREKRIIRCRPNGNDKKQQEPEIIAILHDETDRVNNGLLLVGVSQTSAKPLINANAQQI